MPNGTLFEWLEILNAEVYVDVDKIRRLAQYRGIPREVRGEVWKYLLGVELADRSHEVAVDQAHQEEYAHIDKHHSEYARRVHRDTDRYLARQSATLQAAGSGGGGGLSVRLTRDDDAPVLENVLNAYLNRHTAVEYHAALVPLCAPLVATLDRESDVFFCFERITAALDEYTLEHPVNTRVARFITLFRLTLPELFNYFQEEEVDMNEWISSWLLGLLTRELPLDNIISLWDHYFSHDTFIHFHTYVGLAILKFCRPSLEELEQSEIRTFLLHLPRLDIAQVIVVANNIQTEIQKQDRLDI
ncbi:hypothetical protein H4R33_006044 [Dimargaris cristalligena]|uniref:Rab-GTPase-TBC domain-containing protein n=1 Tax=Dimargaris cristalligena TaxID=215637 RepID=A0A4P9ZWQ6_9FUNG|nr:hypothetical protein H4R33_006044 [Dimargaris cristalligena]RKP38053.1 rab-GTPase-TBC domain-containing protein [Dimargaris cristalligena]|eukprot:RKP38053.1 rab-GTPase-TBC domain-containing protein [Dimargaris cristalligena]